MSQLVRLSCCTPQVGSEASLVLTEIERERERDRDRDRERERV